MPSWQVYSYLILKQLIARIFFGHNSSGGYWEIVIFMFCAIFSNSEWRQSWNAKLQKIKTASYKNYSGTNYSGSISTNGSWDIVIFLCMLFLVTAPGNHLDRYIFI